MIANKLNSLMNLVKNEQNDVLEKYIPEIDFISIADTLLSYTKNEKLIEASEEDLGASIDVLLNTFLNIAQYIETDTTMESLIPDDLYDTLYESYVNLTHKSITGTNNTSGGTRPIKQHKYPELRGSLDKVHFIYDNEIPEKDSRKSLESWFRSVYKKCSAKGIDINKVRMSNYYKFDGVSGVFEASGMKIDNVLTRKDTDNNTGTVITHIFDGCNMENIFGQLIPKEIYKVSEYGVKTEIFMKYDTFEEFKKLPLNRIPKNHRSAASMIINTMAEDFEPEWRDYLTIRPFQISSSEKIELDENSDCFWTYVGIENGRHQYIYTTPMVQDNTSSNNPFNYILGHVNKDIETIQGMADKLYFPIDGIVYTILNDDIVKELGRSDNKNKFQVAFKFAAGIAKTKLIDVIFTVGPVAGTITPLAIVEPVKIMGNTITHISLSNIDKMEKLNLRIGDEVIVKYNIIPTLYKDDTCIIGSGKPIIFPTHCPRCGEELTTVTNEKSGNRIVRCENDSCPRKNVGKIYNYIDKMKIENIGMSTVEDLCDYGILKTIGDLYRLKNYKMSILKIPGYGETKFDNMIKSINSKLVVYPHEFLGSIGIPSLGRRMMKKICTVVNIYDLLNEDPRTLDLLNISGISDKTVEKLCEGILQYRSVIDDVMNYIEFKPYEEDTPSSIKVLFSKIRDKKLEEILETKYNAEIQSTYTKDTDIVIVKDNNVTSTKIDKARKDGKTILTIEDAYRVYKGD